MRCIQRDRECHPRTKDGQEGGADITSTYDLSLKQEGPSDILPQLNSLLGTPVSGENASIGVSNGLRLDQNFGPASDFVLSELTLQLPSLTREDAMPLAQMITQQLRRWNRPAPQLIFRRTKIVEKISQASVTIIDFECSSTVSGSATGSEPQMRHQFTSTLVMSKILDPNNPELQLGCLWAPGFDGREGTTFSKEADHIMSVFRHCSGGESGYRDRFVNAVAIMSITPLYSKHFTNWDSHLASPEAAIQRACAWGVVAAKSREIEYRLFASSLACFLNFELHNNLAFHNQEFDISLADTKNDICCILVPAIRMGDAEIGTYRPEKALTVVFGQEVTGPQPRMLDPTVWHAAVDTISRRGERMIPWITGPKGAWSLSDRFEEIYLDDFSREQAIDFAKMPLTEGKPSFK